MQKGEIVFTNHCEVEAYEVPKAEESSMLRTAKDSTQCVGMSRSEDAQYELISRFILSFLTSFHRVIASVSTYSLGSPDIQVLQMFMLFVLNVLNQFFANSAGPQKLPRRR